MDIAKIAHHAQQPPDTYKFSTFGYNPSDSNISIAGTTGAIVQDIPMHSYRHCRESTRAETASPSNIGVYNYEPVYKYSSPSPVGTTASSTGTATTTSNDMRTFTGGTKKPSKMEESHILLEIRNSAPDVIIMTSH